MALEVVSVCEYFAGHGLGPDHFGPWNIVHAIKGDVTLTGYFDTQIGGVAARIDERSKDLAFKWAGERLAPSLPTVTAGERICLVVIPGHACTNWEHVRDHRLSRVARATASYARKQLGVDCSTWPILSWSQVMPSSHQEGGSRDPDVLAPFYRINADLLQPRPLLVLLDDVVTSGAHLKAAHMVLSAAGYLVSPRALAVARTVNIKGGAFDVLSESCPRS